VAAGADGAGSWTSPADEGSGVQVTWDQVLAWRLRRQFLEPRGGTAASAAAVVSRLGGVQAQVASAAELAVRLRQADPPNGEVQRGLAAGTLVKTWAMRGTLHLLPAAEAASYLSLIAAGRSWARPSWQRAFGATPAEIDALTAKVGELLHGQVLTREELVAAIVADPAFRPVEDGLRSGWGSLLKPMAWQGALCYGPSRGTKVTFTSPASLLPDWPGLPDPEAAAPSVIGAYLGAYGPATVTAFGSWLSRGLRKSLVAGWFAGMRDRLVEVDVDGQPGWILAEHADDLAACGPAPCVRLLGGFDQWILGPGTDEARLLPAAHRALVSKAAGWISPLVLTGGRVTGTWQLDGSDLVVSVFPGSGRPRAADLRAEAAHLARAAGTGPLRARVA
jgi:hypothetical protein